MKSQLTNERFTDYGVKSGVLSVRSSFTSRVRELTEGMATLDTAICPVLVGDFGATAHAIAKGTAPFLLTAMNQLLIIYREGQIKPHIDSSFHFAQAAQAHLRLQEGKNIGKVVTVP